jgi:hypothetical protein
MYSGLCLCTHLQDVGLITLFHGLLTILFTNWDKPIGKYTWRAQRS